MQIFILNVFSEEIGPSSSPDISTLVFSSAEKRSAYIESWNVIHDNDIYEKSGENCYYSRDYKYWLETTEKVLDSWTL